MLKLSFIRYFLIAITFLGSFSTYPKAVPAVHAEEPTTDEVIEISTAQDFQNINNDLTAHYVIVNDIDFEGFELTQIASSANQRFKGTLDGAGYSLKNIVIPYTLNQHNVAVLNVQRNYSFSLIRYNEGSIKNIFFEDISYPTTVTASSFLGTQQYASYFFSIIESNTDSISNIQIKWKQEFFSFVGTAYKVQYSFLSIINSDSSIIEKIKIDSSSASPLKFSSIAEITFAGIAIANFGLIDQIYISINRLIYFKSNTIDVQFAGAVFNNYSFGVIKNAYLNTNISLIFFINDIANSVRGLGLKVSGIVHYNEGVIEFFYNTGILNTVLTMDFIFKSFNIEFSRSIFANERGIYSRSDQLSYGFTDVFFRILTLSKQSVISKLSHINQAFPNNPSKLFLLSNSSNMTKNIIEFGHLDENFHDLYTFVAETGTLSNNFTSPFVNDFDGYIFNLNHFSISQELLATSTSGLTSLTPFELSNQLLTNDEWTHSQLSDINAFVLSFVTLLEFELTNYSIQEIGTAYTVSEDINVTLNEVPLEPGTHYLNDPGEFLFTLNDPNFNITNTVSIIVYSDSTLLPNGIYSGSFTPMLDQGTNATLNGETYNLNTPINTPGNHTLAIIGKNGHTVEYNFTIELVITGVSDNASFYNSVTPSFSGGLATLNGESFITDTMIQAVGYHELIITGTGGFTETIVFTILPDKGDLQNNQSYFSGYTPILSGDFSSIILNGQPYILGTPIILAGTYTLIMNGINGFTETIEFSILLNLFESIEDGKDYLLEVTPNFEGGTATLNGQPFEPGTRINQVGNHTLLIFGLNQELIGTFHFTITESLTNPTEGNLFSYIPNIQGGSYYELNGNPYLLNTPITTPGSYILRVYGINGYYHDYTFNIDLRVGGLQNIEKSSAFIPTFTGGQATLNGEPFSSGDSVTNVGNYHLVITGIGDYKREYNFTIIPLIQSVNDLGVYENSVTPSITGEGMMISLNGQQVNNVNNSITNPGLNTIIITGLNGYIKTIVFTIKPTIIAPAVNSKIINESVTLSWSGGIADLNGDILLGNTHDISLIGNYTFNVRGLNNDFIDSYSFSIIPLVQNLLNNATYQGYVQPIITGQGTLILLNGSPYNNERINTPGLHTLSISGINNFEQSISFNVNLIASGFPTETIGTNSAVAIQFSGGLATLNGVSYVSGELILDVGNYNLIITGVNDFQASYEFNVLPLVQSLIDGASYSGSVSPTIRASGATITLNGNPFNNEIITSPGEHYLVIEGVGNYSLTITFTVLLEFSGIENNAEYTNRINIIIFSGGIGTLNGSQILSGHSNQDIGNHIIVITGVNGFSVTYRFINHPEVNFKTLSSDIYNGNFTPVVDGQGISISLNNQPYLFTNITLPGTHHLRITSPIGSYTRVYTFTIDLLTSDIEHNKIYSDWISPTFSGGMITLNGNDYQSGTRIESIGYFTLVVTGVNGFEETFVFTILPYIIDMPLPNSVQTSFALDINALHSLTQMTLNGIIYTESTPIVAIGHYDLLITFNGFPLVEHKFTIEPNDYIEDGSTFDSPFLLAYSNAEVYINGRLRTNAYRFDQQGTYVIEIKGVGEYYHTFTIEFINPNIDRTLLLLLPLAISMSLPLLAYGLRRRKVV
jgi:hypothetical protein